MPDRRERVLLEQVVDRDLALVLDVRIGAADRFFVELDRDEALLARAGVDFAALIFG